MSTASPTIEVPPKVAPAPAPLPIWIRMPTGKEVCPYTSLRRGKLALLSVPSAANKWNPPVRSKAIKQEGQNRAVRLINLASLLDYIDQLPDDETEGEE